MTLERVEKDLTVVLQRHSGQQEIPELAEDLFAALGIRGDDVNAFFEEFEEPFSVDMTSLLWYFHVNHDAPRQTRHTLPYLPNGQVALYHPITLTNLVEAAQSGH